MLRRGESSTGAKPASVDDQGFQEVRGRYRKPRDDRSWLKPEGPFPPLPTEAGNVGPSAAADAKGDQADPSCGQARPDVVLIQDDESEPTVEEEANAPTLDQLRATLDAKQRVVRALEASEDVSEDCEVLIAARLARDKAKAAFEAARPTRPAFQRIRPAEQRLARATKAKEAVRGKMHQLEMDYKFKLSELEMELDDAESRLADAQAEYDNVLSQLPPSTAVAAAAEAAAQGDRLKSERCEGVLRALRAAGPQLQGVAQSLVAISPLHAEEIRKVVQVLDVEYQQTTAVVQRSTAFFSMDDEGSEHHHSEEDFEREIDSHGPGCGGAAPSAASGAMHGNAAAAGRGPRTSPPSRPRTDDTIQPPSSKRHCDGDAPMEDSQGDDGGQITAEQCYAMAQAAGVMVDIDLHQLSPLQVTSWALSNGVLQPC